MDRSKWEYKKLGEVAKFIGGGTPSKANEDYYTGNIPWATVRDMVDFNLSKTELCITDQAVKESATNIIPKDTIIISTHVGLGKICLLMQDTAINQDLKGVILPQSIDKMFFAAWYKSIADYVISNGKGATVKGVTMKFVNDLKIPVPPVADQQRIVEELDCLNEMIALKQEQLKEFDKLAQSIFYDMFLNEDNASFERIDLNECVKEMHLGPFGSALKNEFFVPKEQGYCMVYEQQHAIKKTMNLPTRYVDENKYRELERFEVGPGDILMSCRGTIGEVYIIPDCAPKGIIHPSLMKIRLNPTYIEKTYFLYLLSHIIKDKDSNGATIKMAITAKELGKERIPLPPLALQQQFAEKIQAIEVQKELVKKSIAETQQLLDSRMDYYFN